MHMFRTFVCGHEAISWWRHQMETFSALLALCAGNSPVYRELPAQRPVTRSFGVFFDLRLIKRLSKHSRGWWFETLSRPKWRHCNVILILQDFVTWTSVWLSQCQWINPAEYRWTNHTNKLRHDMITTRQSTANRLHISSKILYISLPVIIKTYWHWKCN